MTTGDEHRGGEGGGAPAGARKERGEQDRADFLEWQMKAGMPREEDVRSTLRHTGAAEALRDGIAARDAVEEMLAAQMVACHDAAMACLREARCQSLPESAKTTQLRTGARLMALFTQQLGALERHRMRVRAEREAERARLYPATGSKGPAVDEAVFERLCQRFERRLNGQGEAGADAGNGAAPASAKAAGAGVPEPVPEAALNRQQRRALERLRRKQARRG